MHASGALVAQVHVRTKRRSARPRFGGWMGLGVKFYVETFHMSNFLPTLVSHTIFLVSLDRVLNETSFNNACGAVCVPAFSGHVLCCPNDYGLTPGPRPG